MPLTWAETWILALTRPSVATFEHIAHDPDATSRRAYKWIFIAFFIGDVLSISIDFFRNSSSVGFNRFLPTSAIFAVFFTSIFALIAHKIALKMGGTGTYPRLVYSFAASLAPIGLISATFGLIPIVQYLVIPLFLYGIVLNIFAVRAVHQLGWKNAAVSTLTPVLVGLTVAAVAVVGFVFVMSKLMSQSQMRDQDYYTLFEEIYQIAEASESIPSISVGFDPFPINRWNSRIIKRQAAGW